MSAGILHLRAEQGLAVSEQEQIREVVHGGKMLIFPTDTIYGLGCDAFNDRAVERVYRIKGRAPERPFSVHVASVSVIEQYVAPLTGRQRDLLERLLPGPYTVVMRASPMAPPMCVSHEGKIGLRVPASRSFRLVYEAPGRPLVGTSANRSGEPPLPSIDEIIERFSHAVDLIVATDEPMTQVSSSVIDITVDPPRVLRGRLPEGIVWREDH